MCVCLPQVRQYWLSSPEKIGQSHGRALNSGKAPKASQRSLRFPRLFWATGRTHMLLGNSEQQQGAAASFQLHGSQKIPEVMAWVKKLRFL